MNELNALKVNSLITEEHVEQYQRDGYALIKNVFSQAEIDQIAASFDNWKRFASLMGRTWRKQNTIIWVDQGDEPITRGMQWPSYHDSTMAKIRIDNRMLEIIEPFIGNDVKQIINQMHWKQPLSKINWPLHRDVRSRQPVEAFTDLFDSWVQTGIAIDPHRVENGAMSIVPGSHLDHPSDPKDESLYCGQSYEDDSRICPLLLEPGDVAIWNAYTVHGGGLNKTEFQDRRFYINGYVKSEKCTRGEWAWKNGRSVPLVGEQALVQFDQIDEIKESFYPEDRGIAEMRRD